MSNLSALVLDHQTTSDNCSCFMHVPPMPMGCADCGHPPYAHHCDRTPPAQKPDHIPHHDYTPPTVTLMAERLEARRQLGLGRGLPAYESPRGATPDEVVPLIPAQRRPEPSPIPAPTPAPVTVPAVPASLPLPRPRPHQIRRPSPISRTGTAPSRRRDRQCPKPPGPRPVIHRPHDVEGAQSPHRSPFRYGSRGVIWTSLPSRTVVGNVHQVARRPSAPIGSASPPTVPAQWKPPGVMKKAASWKPPGVLRVVMPWRPSGVASWKPPGAAEVAAWWELPDAAEVVTPWWFPKVAKWWFPEAAEAGGRRRHLMRRVRPVVMSGGRVLDRATEV